MEKVLGSAQISQPWHSLKPKPNLRQGPNANAVRAERDEEAVEERFDLAGVDFVKFKGRCHLCSIRVHGRAASGDVEAAASYPEDLAKIINEGGYTKQQVFSTDKTDFC